MKLSARKLLNETPLFIKNNIAGPGFNVVFEDGNIEVMSGPDIVLSRYYWEFLRLHNMLVTSDMAITKFYDDGYFTSSSHGKFLNYVYKKYIKDYLIPNGQLTFDNMHNSWYTMFNILNSLFSELQYNVLEYGVSLNILDFIELQKDKELLTIIEDGMKDNLNPKHIELVNKRIQNLLLENPDNNLAKLWNCGVTNKTQVGHSIGRRGFVTDINNMIFSEAVNTNLVKGFDGFYDLACESAVMAKALNLQERGVRYSEWLQRELHLSAMSIQSVKLTDCGNDYYHPWYVKDLKELSLLEGTNVLIDGKEVELDMTIHKHLVDTVINIRRLNDCKLLKSGHVCMKCLGAFTYSMPGFASVSHTLLTIAMAVIGQLMLSAKHFTDSTTLKDIKLDPTSSKYFTVKATDSELIWKTGNEDKKILLTSTAYNGFRFFTSKDKDKIDTTDTSKLSKVDTITVITDSNGTIFKETVQVKIDGRSGILTTDFIKYSLDNTILTNTGDYIVDMCNFKGSMFQLENKEFAYDQFNFDFKSLLLSFGVGKKVTTVESAISQVFNYLNTKLTINIKVVELMIAGLTVEGKLNGDYSIGLDRDKREVMSYKTVILGRGAGVALGFQDQKVILNNINSVPVWKPYNPLEEVWNTKTRKIN